MKKLKKLLTRLILPSAEDITTLATRTIVEFINNSGKGEVIAKYGTMADDFTKVQANITNWLRDGKIDDEEQKKLYNALLPLAQKLVEEVKK
jgi:hypothetical protein